MRRTVRRMQLTSSKEKKACNDVCVDGNLNENTIYDIYLNLECMKIPSEMTIHTHEMREAGMSGILIRGATIKSICIALRGLRGRSLVRIGIGTVVGDL